MNPRVLAMKREGREYVYWVKKGTTGNLDSKTISIPKTINISSKDRVGVC